MNMTGKWVMWGAFVLIIGFGAWYYTKISSSSTFSSWTAQTQTDNEVPPPAASETGQVSAQGTANADLDADLSALDAQIQGASADSSSAASFNDAPVEQTDL